MAEFFHIPIMLTTELISVPTGIVFLCALGTIWMGRIHFKVPMLWVFGFLWAFLIGGITGVFLADVPTDITLSDTYFVVAHFHYTIVGGTIFGLFAGTYYWFPKITGRMYDERLGRLHFWWFTIAFNAAFIPMFWLGIEGMRRRVADYPAGFGTVNLFISLAALNIALSVGGLRLQHGPILETRRAGGLEPVARPDPRMADDLAAPGRELRPDPDRDRFAISIRKHRLRRRAGAGRGVRARDHARGDRTDPRRRGGRAGQHAARRQARDPVGGHALRRAVRRLLRDAFRESRMAAAGSRAPRLLLPGINTLLLVASSVTMQWAVRSARGQGARASAALVGPDAPARRDLHHRSRATSSRPMASASAMASSARPSTS